MDKDPIQNYRAFVTNATTCVKRSRKQRLYIQVGFDFILDGMGGERQPFPGLACIRVTKPQALRFLKDIAGGMGQRRPEVKLGIASDSIFISPLSSILQAANIPNEWKP